MRNYNGTLNQETDVKDFSALISNPITHITSKTVIEEYVGKTRSRQLQSYYEQNQQEQLVRNQHTLKAPHYKESITHLNATLGNDSIHAGSIRFQGGVCFIFKSKTKKLN